MYPEPAASITKTVNGANSIVKLGPYSTLTLDLSQDLVDDHWYLVDVTATEPLQGTQPGTLRIPSVASDNAGNGYDMYGSGGLGVVYEQNDHKGYEFTTIDPELPMEYDPALINGTGDLNISRVLFNHRQGSTHYQQNDTNIKIQRVDSSQQAEIRSVNVLDVTDNNFIVANPSAWSSVGNQVPNPRAIINGTQNTGYTLPRVYKKDNKIQIDKRPTSNSNVSNSTTATQVITNVFQTVPSDGTNYQVNFSISENWLNELNLGGADYITANVYYSNDESSYNSLFTGTFDDVGDYSFIIPETPEDYNAIRLRFYGNGSGIGYVGAVCAIDNVSLMQTVTTFNPGNAGAWVISGFDQTLYDYVTWNNGAIEFDEAPNFSTISQAVELEEGLSLIHI